MTDREFVQIIASAILMVLRALNKRYGLHLWILTNQERRDLVQILRGCDGTIRVVELERYFGDLTKL